VRKTGMKAIPVNTRPMSEINSAFDDLHDGKVIGRTVLVP
jgi:D-arabinose 1-dehydrogenase-like Zn-dependent alcohol dehydrogenase